MRTAKMMETAEPGVRVLLSNPGGALLEIVDGGRLTQLIFPRRAAMALVRGESEWTEEEGGFTIRLVPPTPRQARWWLFVDSAGFSVTLAVPENLPSLFAEALERAKV